MSEEKLSKAETIAKSVEKISDSKGLAAIGQGFGMGISMLAFALIFVAMYFSIFLMMLLKNGMDIFTHKLSVTI